MIYKYLYAIAFFCFLTSCSGQQKDPNTISLIKISYSPSFHTSAELLLNENDNYLIIKATRKYLPIVKSDSNYVVDEKFLEELAPVSDTIITVKSEEFKDINRIISGFKKADFTDAEFPHYDGMSTSILIVYENKMIKVIQPMNNPNDQQRKLLITLATLALNKTTSKDNKTVLTSILSYLK